MHPTSAPTNLAHRRFNILIHFTSSQIIDIAPSLKCLCNEIFTPFFILFLKNTAGMMKNDVYSLFLSHLIPKLSHFLYFEL